VLATTSTNVADRSGKKSPCASSTPAVITNAYAVQSRHVVRGHTSDPRAESGIRISAFARNSHRDGSTAQAGAPSRAASSAVQDAPEEGTASYGTSSTNPSAAAYTTSTTVIVCLENAGATGQPSQVRWNVAVVSPVGYDMSTGAWIAIAAVALAVAFGSYRALTDGRFRGTRTVGTGATTGNTAVAETPGSRRPGVATTWTQVSAALPDATLGAQATLLQFSSAFCAPCRATRRTLADVAQAVPGVEHLEVDAEQHLDLVRVLGIMRTPTTLVLDAAGQEVTRAVGAPRKEQVIAALGTTT
jgi:thiol-disulfide isomerase/thioredoxin